MKLKIWSKEIFGHEMNKNACNNFIFYFSGIMEENVKIDIIEHFNTEGRRVVDTNFEYFIDPASRQIVNVETLSLQFNIIQSVWWRN